MTTLKGSPYDAIMSVAGMMFVRMLLTVLDGFQWLIPVYFLKLLAGFTAKDDVGFGPLDMADIAGEVHSGRANAANLS